MEFTDCFCRYLLADFGAFFGIIFIMVITNQGNNMKMLVILTFTAFASTMISVLDVAISGNTNGFCPSEGHVWHGIITFAVVSVLVAIEDWIFTNTIVFFLIVLPIMVDALLLRYILSTSASVDVRAEEVLVGVLATLALIMLVHSIGSKVVRKRPCVSD